MHQIEFEQAGFEWIDCNDVDSSVITLTRRSHNPEDDLVVALNFTPIVRRNYRFGVPRYGFWRELLNSDSPHYGGSGQGNLGGGETSPIPLHNRPCSLTVTLPPLSALFFKCSADRP